MKKTSVFHFFIQAVPVFILVSSFFVPLASNAETRYISGVIVVNIRNTNEEQYKVVDSVETGDQVDVLEEKGRFAKVKTKHDIEGWVPKQYLRKDAPAVETIVKLKEELADLKKKNDELEAGKASAGSDTVLNDQQKETYDQTIDSLKSENKRLVEDNQKLLKSIQEKETAATENQDGKEAEKLKEKVTLLQNQLDVLKKNSQNIIQITKERDRLKVEAATLQSDLAGSRELNKKLEMDRMLHWFFAGAAVFFLGFLTSKIFARKKSKLTF
jgi:SH3 domain protein